MNLSPATIEILQNFATINPQLAFKAGNVVKTVCPNKTILAKATIEEEFPQDFAINDLGVLLKSYALFTDPVLSFSPKSLTITNDDTGAKLTYKFANEEHISAAPGKEIKLPSEDVKFELSSEALGAAIKAAGVLGLGNVAVIGENKKVYFSAISAKDRDGSNFKYPVGTTKESFCTIFKADNLKILSRDYKVVITSKGLAHFATDNLEYWVAIETDSKFGE